MPPKETSAKPSFEYGDPLEVLIRKEAGTCKGCEFELKGTVFGKTLLVCTAKDSKGMRRNHGKRCIKYREKTTT
jgi:hypothetical protein